VSQTSYGLVRILGCTLQSTEKFVRSERFVPFGNMIERDPAVRRFLQRRQSALL